MSDKPIEWVDLPLNTKERKVLAPPVLNVPGLRMFGYHSTSHAIPALTLHFHKNSFEFTFISQGTVRFAVDDRIYPLSGGDVFITTPNEVHDTGSFPMSLHTMYWFQLDISDPSHILYLSPDASKTLLERLNTVHSRVVSMNTVETTNLLEAVFRYFRRDDSTSHIQGAQLLGFFLLQLVEASGETSFRITPDIGKAINYIMDHLHEDLSMEVLAAESLLSVSRFKQKFKSQMGTSPRNFINSQKIEMSKRMLLEGFSVTDVAMDLNFSSSNYFSSVFRRYTLLSPSEYIAKEREREKEGTDEPD